MTYSPLSSVQDQSIQIGEIVDEYISSSILFGSQNLIPSADFASFSSNNKPVGWSRSWIEHTSGNFFQTYKDLPIWTFEQAGCGISQVGSDGTSTRGIFLANDVPVQPNQFYEYSAYSGSHRCTCELWIDWLDKDKTYITTTHNSANKIRGDGMNSSEKWGGKSIDDFKRLLLIAQSPGNAAYARPYLIKHNTYAGEANSYAFWNRPYFGVCRENQTIATQWQPTRPFPWELMGFTFHPSTLSWSTSIALGALLYPGNLSFYLPDISDVRFTFNTSLRFEGIIVPGTKAEYRARGIFFLDGTVKGNWFESGGNHTDHVNAAKNIYSNPSGALVLEGLSAGLHTLNIYYEFLPVNANINHIFTNSYLDVFARLR